MTSETINVDSDAVKTDEEEMTIGNQVFGFWLYLMSDLVLFATLFATYAVLAQSYAGGPSGKELFNLPYTFGETMLLLTSSATCGLAILGMHGGSRNQVLLWLTITFFLGLGFIVMEVHEFRAMILEGNGPERSGFLSAFFTLVSTHGLHVASGLIWIAVLLGQVIVKGLTTPVQSRLIRMSMFWHFLDIVWVAVFTIVYLIGVL
ncbi:MAG: cytochrome o ubiquinol oxidase subunit III [Desulforhopalus sp.]